MKSSYVGHKKYANFVCQENVYFLFDLSILDLEERVALEVFWLSWVHGQLSFGVVLINDIYLLTRSVKCGHGAFAEICNLIWFCISSTDCFVLQELCCISNYLKQVENTLMTEQYYLIESTNTEQNSIWQFHSHSITNISIYLGNKDSFLDGLIYCCLLFFVDCFVF